MAMTIKEFNQLEAGRGVDRVIVESIIDLPVFVGNARYGDGEETLYVTKRGALGWFGMVKMKDRDAVTGEMVEFEGTICPAFSVRLADAFSLLELVGAQYAIEVFPKIDSIPGVRQWAVCRVRNPMLEDGVYREEGFGIGPTIPLAICRAVYARYVRLAVKAIEGGTP